MLRAVSWVMRAGAYVLVGSEAFRRLPGHVSTATLTVVVCAFVLSGLLMAAWGLLDRRLRPADERRRFLPVLLGGMAVAGGTVCTFPSAGPLLAIIMIAVLDAGTYAGLLGAWIVTGCGALAMEAGALVSGAGRGAALGYPLLLLVALLAGLNRRAYRVKAEQSAAMLAQVERLREEQHRVAVLDERTRIAREIHDVLAHSLGGLGIQIQAARALLTDHGDVERAVDVLTRAQRLAGDGLAETRRAVHALRTEFAPLEQELAAMAEDHRQQHGATARLTVEGEPVPLAADQTLCLVRTAQECLTNAAKHARGQRVALALHFGDEEVRLTVTNPLTGHPGEPATGPATDAVTPPVREPDAESGSEPGDGNGSGTAPLHAPLSTVDGGFGLTGMRERLLLAGGTLDAGVHGGSWTVTARVPR